MYKAKSDRYENMTYLRCGNSGLKLPAVSLGMWHNFGSVDRYENAREMVHTAFDLGITHFDLANNYGPEPGSAEITFGRILASEMKPYRDEMIISTKAGYYMWPGPYGEWGSKKYLTASLDQSLSRMGLDYVDIFYSHRFDPETPMHETMEALATAVKSGKALYAGISSYPPEQTELAYDILKSMGVTLLIHQPRYSMLDRTLEHGLSDTLDRLGVGTIAFSPLAQGVLTDRYLNGVPADSRAARKSGFLNAEDLNERLVSKIRALSEIASARGQSMAAMALSWAIVVGRLTSTLIGASRPEQIITCAAAADNLNFTVEELAAIEDILAK